MIMTDEARKIIEKIQEVITRIDVQPGYPDDPSIEKGVQRKPGMVPGITWCNRGANYIVTELGFNMKPFLNPRGINWTTANNIYTNAENNAQEVFGAEAQALANSAKLVLAVCFNPKGSGHVAVVAPSEEEYDDTFGPVVGETGARCRITHSKLAFEKYGYKARFFIVPKKTV
jgi:hypothetical protein